MARRDYPVSKAQQMVLDALGMTASGYSDAQDKFEELGLVVSSKRQGRSSVPAITVKSRETGGWNPGGDGWSGRQYDDIDTSAIEQWIVRGRTEVSQRADRLTLSLGVNEAERRKEALEQIADSVGAVGQRGASISVMLQMIADEDLLVMEVTDMFKIGDTVRVKPHTVWRHLSKGAVVNPPKTRRHNGYRKATVTGFSDGGQVEVEVNGAYDYVPARSLELLERSK